MWNTEAGLAVQSDPAIGVSPRLELFSPPSSSYKQRLTASPGVASKDQGCLACRRSGSPPRTNGACGYGLHGLWAGAANVDRRQGVFRLRWHPSRSATPRFGVREPDRLTPFGVRCLSPRGMGSNRSSQIDTAGRFRRVPPRMPTYRCSRLGKGGAGQCPPWSLEGGDLDRTSAG